MTRKRVVVLCAHSDDQTLGAGGYIAKLASEGIEVRTVICSYGEKSHPHLKPEEVIPTRIAESEKADKILGGNGVTFLGLRESKFFEDYKEPEMNKKIMKLFKKFKPDTILTHAVDDPHPDHRAVLRVALDIHDTEKLKCEVFSFGVWNVANLKKRRCPFLIVDITKQFHKKIKSIEVFKSQIPSLIMLLWSVYAKALFWGLRNKTKYAEVYYKVR